MEEPSEDPSEQQKQETQKKSAKKPAQHVAQELGQESTQTYEEILKEAPEPEAMEKPGEVLPQHSIPVFKHESDEASTKEGKQKSKKAKKLRRTPLKWWEA